MQTHTLVLPEVDLVYDVRGPLPTADGRPPLLLIGQPMDASGFVSLAGLLPGRTVVTYDPRGLARSSVRRDGRLDMDPLVHAEDLHRLIAEIGGPVEVLGSSGGAISGLALVATYPEDVVTLVAHEPPLCTVVPDAAASLRARQGFHEAYMAKGMGAGMAQFIAMTSWQGEFTDAYFDQPAADPALFGLPTEDDGDRSDPLLSDRAFAVTDYVPDVGALTAAPTRVFVGVGEESAGTFTARTSEALARLLGEPPVVFPSHHGGFAGPEMGPYAGKPAEFAACLETVLTPTP